MKGPESTEEWLHTERRRGRQRLYGSIVSVSLTAVGGAGLFENACASSTAQQSDAGSQPLDATLGPSGDLTSPALDTGAAPQPLVCPPSPADAFTPSTYESTVAHQGACTAAALAAFVASCVDPTDAADACEQWMVENVDNFHDAGPGSACGNCLFARANNGAMWVDPFGYWWPDYAVCIQVTDATHGLDCAAAYVNMHGCRDFACESCVGTAAFLTSCMDAVDQGSCRSFWTTYESACASDLVDGGAVDTCHPTMGGLPDYTYIATLICGGAVADAETD